MTEPRFKEGDKVLAYPECGYVPGEIVTIGIYPTGTPYYQVRDDRGGRLRSVWERYLISVPIVDRLAELDDD